MELLSGKFTTLVSTCSGGILSLSALVLVVSLFLGTSRAGPDQRDVFCVLHAALGNYYYSAARMETEPLPRGASRAVPRRATPRAPPAGRRGALCAAGHERRRRCRCRPQEARWSSCPTGTASTSSKAATTPARHDTAALDRASRGMCVWRAARRGVAVVPAAVQSGTRVVGAAVPRPRCAPPAGPLVVLVHGFLGSTAYLRFLARELVGTHNRRVLRFDLMGRGPSCAKTCPATDHARRFHGAARTG